MASFKQKLKNSSDASAGIDAGLGLIFRLNILWGDSDRSSVAGDFEKWNFLLDRVFCNLAYKDTITVLKNTAGDVVDVELAVDEKKVYDFFAMKIREARVKKKNAIKNKSVVEYNKAQQEYYEVLLKKDTWLRNYMHDRGLYLKEFEFNPGTALFGGGA